MLLLEKGTERDQEDAGRRLHKTQALDESSLMKQKASLDSSVTHGDTELGSPAAGEFSHQQTGTHRREHGDGSKLKIRKTSVLCAFLSTGFLPP